MILILCLYLALVYYYVEEDTFSSKGRISNPITANFIRQQAFLNSLPKVSKFQLSIINGLLLGSGGYFNKGPNSTNYHFTITSPHIFLLMWIITLFPKLGTTNVIGSGPFIWNTFETPYFTALCKTWKPEGSWIIPDYVYEEFDIIVLAFWFMRAGSTCGNQLRISIKSLTTEQRERVAEAITKNLGLPVKITRQNLVFDRAQATALLIPFVHTSQHIRFLHQKKTLS